MNNIEREIFNGVAGTIAELTTSLIVRAGQTWRFYFDDLEQSAIKNKTKIFLLEIIKNAKRK